MSNRFVDYGNALKGRKFGKLLVIDSGRSEGERLYWKCECACGVICEVRSENLKSGKTKSCGCQSRKLTEEDRVQIRESNLKGVELAKKYGVDAGLISRIRKSLDTEKQNSQEVKL